MEKDKKTHVIKRYQNRKLYDTEHSCYVTLEDISQLIKKGIDVVIVDNRTNEDLTTLTLTQIILEEEKNKKNILPLATLRNIIQMGGEQIAHFVQKSFQETVSSITNVRGEAEKVIDKLKDEFEDGGALLRDYLTKTQQTIDDITKKLEGKVKSIGGITNLPILRTEIRSLRKKVDALEQQVGHFEREEQ